MRRIHGVMFWFATAHACLACGDAGNTEVLRDPDPRGDEVGPDDDGPDVDGPTPRPDPRPRDAGSSIPTDSTVDPRVQFDAAARPTLDAGSRPLTPDASLPPDQGTPGKLGVFIPLDQSNVAHDLSADGRVVVGRMPVPPLREVWRPFRWSAAEGLVWLGGVGEQEFGEALAVDGSGRRIVGRLEEAKPSQWSAPDWTKTTGVAGLSTAALDISDDGLLILGQDKVGPSGGMRTLTRLAGTSACNARTLSGNGRYAAGGCSRNGRGVPVVWDGTSPRELECPSKACVATGLSSDGDTVIGFSSENPKVARQNVVCWRGGRAFDLGRMGAAAAYARAASTSATGRIAWLSPDGPMVGVCGGRTVKVLELLKNAQVPLTGREEAALKQSFVYTAVLSADGRRLLLGPYAVLVDLPDQL